MNFQIYTFIKIYIIDCNTCIVEIFCKCILIGRLDVHDILKLTTVLICEAVSVAICNVVYQREINLFSINIEI
mgnify:CR=1 FL=1